MNLEQDFLSLISTAEDGGHKLPLDKTLEVVKAIKGISTEPQIIDKVVQLITQYNNQKTYLPLLSNRQQQILSLIGLGLTSRDIAQKLNISEATVSTHRKNIIKKLQISGTRQLQNYAYQYIQGKMS